MNKINISEKFGSFNTFWDPKIVGELNRQHVKLVKIKGKFDWHKHDEEDEMFFVVKGSFQMLFRDKSVEVNEGEFIIIPKGTEHCPEAKEEAHVMLFEPAGTINTGNTESSKRVDNPAWI